MEQRRHLSQRHLRPNHVLSRPTTDAVLRSNPDRPIGRRWIHEQYVNAEWFGARGRARLGDDVRIGEPGRGNDFARLCADVAENLQGLCCIAGIA